MFSNIGHKIKMLAIVCCVIGMLLTLIITIAMAKILPYGEQFVLPMLIVGFLLSWIGNFCLYGFGQLIEHVKNIDEKLNGTCLPNQTEQKKEQAKQWLDEGLITEDEYFKSIS